jgi:hypothetical protein
MDEVFAMRYATKLYKDGRLEENSDYSEFGGCILGTGEHFAGYIELD